MNPFSCVQATWNLLETSATSALAEAHASGWDVIVKEGLANGRLASRANGDAPLALRHVADRHGTPVDAIALAGALAQPWATVVLSGAVTEAQLASNARSVGVALDASELAELGAIAEPADRYWARRSQLAWS